jgi:hypothetical protein
VLALYEAAGEAGGSFRHSWEPSRSGGGVGAADPERSAAEAARRARTRLRRYCAANRLNRLGTLTYRGTGCHDPRRVRGDLHEFFRGLRRLLGGEAFPYVWVPEWHKTGHGLHAHFAVGRFIGRRLIERAWGRGFVHIKLLGDLPVGSGAWHEARLAAWYLAKYVAKGLDDRARRPKGLHRYEVAEGFQPLPVTVHGRTVREALVAASERMGGAPVRVWQSREEPEWQGPPAVWAQWA